MTANTIPVESTIKTVTDAIDTSRAVETIVQAFAADPVARWLYPDLRGFATSFPKLVRAFAGPAPKAGESPTLYPMMRDPNTSTNP